MALYTKVSGKVSTVMVSEYNYGLTELSTKADGRIIKLRVEESFGMRMVTYLMGNGKRTKLTDSEPTLM